MVDTFSDGGKVVAHYSVGEDVRSVSDADRAALVFPVAWNTDVGIAVFGRVCPEPMLDDLSMLDAPTDGGCGIDVDQFSLRVFQPERGEWSEIDLDVPLLSGQGLDVLSTGRTSVLFRGGDRTDEDRPAVYELDLSTGSVSDLGVVPQALAPTWCASNGAYLSIVLPDQTRPESADSAEGFLLRDGRPQVVPLDQAALVPLGCSEGSLVAIEPSGSALVRMAATTSGVGITAAALPSRTSIPANRRIDVGRKRPGQAPFLWEVAEDSFQLWELSGDSWSKVGLPRPGDDPPLLASVVDGQAFAFARSGSVVTLTAI